MHDIYESLERLCDVVSEEISDATSKLETSGGKLTSGDTDYLDKLTHMLKSIKTTMAMMDADYSHDMNDGSSYRSNRGMSTRRNSRGQYSRTMMPNYYRSYDGDMISELHELMDEAPNNQIRQKFQQFINEIERMK